MKYTRRKNKRTLIYGGTTPKKTTGNRPSCYDVATLPFRALDAACVTCVHECCKEDKRTIPRTPRSKTPTPFPRRGAPKKRSMARGTRQKKFKRKRRTINK